jgi:hypothetical protein
MFETVKALITEMSSVRYSVISYNSAKLYTLAN